MKYFACAVAFLATFSVFAQKEANNWYFGGKAGIHFLDDGSVAVLTGSKMTTSEGCSSISDSNGNLLFYTDGRTIWDRNHVVMPNGDYFNGTGLLGDPSSTQSAIIVPKKNNPDIYYVFTVDEPHQANASAYPNQYNGTYNEGQGSSGSIPQDDDGYNNGMNYSVIDISVTGTNGSIGDVVTRNVPLTTYDPTSLDQLKYKCSEKVTAVKNSNGTGFWVVTHFVNSFYAFEVTAAGVNETPVISNTFPIVGTNGYRRNAIGCIRASPDGRHIAIAHEQVGSTPGGNADNGVVYLYDFDKATGTVSNPLRLIGNSHPYGLEFSPLSKKLYVATDDPATNAGSVYQFDLLATDIAASSISVGSGNATTMQLGPNGKIYKSVLSSSALDVINAPDETGIECGYQPNGVILPATMASIFGLPPFITSLFSANITVTLTCKGQPALFGLTFTQPIDGVVWNFGDGTPTTTQLTPTHNYAATGSFIVTATVTHDGETEDITKEVVITPVPVANAVPSLSVCDTDGDGTATFDLTVNTAALLGTQNSADYTVSYFNSQDNADANLHPINAATYINTTNPETIFGRVHNKQSSSCYALTSFQITAYTAPVFTAAAYTECDDAQDGNDTNGQATFNLAAIGQQLVQGTGYTTTWYTTDANAQAATNPVGTSYYNAAAGSFTLYLRAENTASPACFGTQAVVFSVGRLPAVVTNAQLTQCDTGRAPDGFTVFSLSQADALFTAANPAGFTVEYYTDTTAAASIANALPADYTNTSNPQTITAKVINNDTGCFRLLPLTLNVNVTAATPVSLAECDDDGTEDGYRSFDLAQAGLENGVDTVTYYTSENDALLEQNAIASPYTNTTAGQQLIYARVENSNNCTALTELTLIVRALPDIPVQDTAVVCLNTKAFITIDAGVTGANYTYLWSTGATTQNISVNQPGDYTVMVTDTTYPENCGKLRTVTVVPSNIAHIDDIVIHDLSGDNTITLVVSPTGGVTTTYLYSIDEPNGPWQEDPFFENVTAGDHTLYIYDTNNCGIVKEDVALLEIPNYFTPNGDSNHDYWRVLGIGSSYYHNSKVFIYDRYGKLIIDLPTNSRGWDGSFNGHPLPSTDYWYRLNLSDGREVRGHFSLVR